VEEKALLAVLTELSSRDAEGNVEEAQELEVDNCDDHDLVHNNVLADIDDIELQDGDDCNHGYLEGDFASIGVVDFQIEVGYSADDISVDDVVDDVEVVVVDVVEDVAEDVVEDVVDDDCILAGDAD